jgi:hypothetical protein
MAANVMLIFEKRVTKRGTKGLWSSLIHYQDICSQRTEKNNADFFLGLKFVLGTLNLRNKMLLA